MVQFHLKSIFTFGSKANMSWHLSVNGENGFGNKKTVLVFNKECFIIVMPWAVDEGLRRLSLFTK